MSGVEVDVQLAIEGAAVPGEADLAAWARAALAGRREAGELTVRVVGADESETLNRTYRGGAGPTNVLAFGFDAPDAPPAAPGGIDLIGDVVVCAPVVEREAAEQGKSARTHYAHMVVHGTLHLLGFDHDAPDSAGRMEAIEREILAGLGFPDPYADPDAEAAAP